MIQLKRILYNRMQSSIKEKSLFLFGAAALFLYIIYSWLSMDNLSQFDKHMSQPLKTQMSPEIQPLHKSQQRIGIGLVISTTGVFEEDVLNLITDHKTVSKNDVEKHIKTLQFFTKLIPSFCQSASSSAMYKFYVAYHQQDSILKHESCRETFVKLFHDLIKESCIRTNGNQTMKIQSLLVFVASENSIKTSDLLNEAMMDAFADDCNYLYQIDHQTKLKTNNWTELFITTLQNFNPNKIGVVGPALSMPFPFTISRVAINLEAAFVHRGHIQIFSYYYPPDLPMCLAKVWMTQVYQPDNARQLLDVLVTGVSSCRGTYTAADIQHLHGFIKRDVKKLAEWKTKSLTK